jgi:hypothetical protein
MRLKSSNLTDRNLRQARSFRVLAHARLCYLPTVHLAMLCFQPFSPGVADENVAGGAASSLCSGEFGSSQSWAASCAALCPCRS